MNRSDLHRRSIRLPAYDYAAPGAYFITMLTAGKTELFGHVATDEMRLSACGRIAEDCWRLIPAHFPQVELSAFVVMPDHMHGIIVLHETGGSAARMGTIYRAHTENIERFQRPVAGSMPTIVRTFKAAVSRRIAAQYDLRPVWQRNYYEHIIRNAREWERICLYIERNPANWAKHQERA